MPDSEDRLTEEGAQNAARRPVAAGASRQRNKSASPAPRHADEHPAQEMDDRTDTALDGDISDEDRMTLLVDGLQDDVLPDLPKMPGFHVCWLTTTNPRDPIARRVRAGYQLIRWEELGKDFQGFSLKTGDYAGIVGVNEMLAAKIPERAYQRAMRTLHHDRPMAEESKLRANVDLIKQNASRAGAQIVEEGDGTAELGTGAPVPRFAA